MLRQILKLAQFFQKNLDMFSKKFVKFSKKFVKFFQKISLRKQMSSSSMAEFVNISTGHRRVLT